MARMSPSASQSRCQRSLSLLFFAVLLVGGLSACSSTSEPAASGPAAPASAPAGASASEAASRSSGGPRDGFVSLFDGETLEGWHRHEDLPGDQVGGKWEAAGGAIVGDQDPPGYGGFLVTDDAYRDYVLTLETKLDYPVDSGIFLRVGPTGESHQVTLDYRPEGTIGAIYMAYLNGFVQQSPDGWDLFERNAWNDVKVRIEGEPAHIQVWLNGERITDFQHTAATTEGAPATGSIGLQVHPGESYEAGNKVRFRNIEVRPL